MSRPRPRTPRADTDDCEIVVDGEARACITHWRQWHGDTPCPASLPDPEVDA